MNKVIDCKRVNFSYDCTLALNGFSFQAYRGEVVAVLGPNGAGKTTSVRVMNGLLSAQSGTVNVLGEDASRNGAQIRLRSGVLTETPALYERLTARQNLSFFGALSGLSAAEVGASAERLMDMFRLADRLDERVGSFSKGMKQKLAIARAMLHDPELLFLDEPTSDLDPEAARQVGDTILEVASQKKRTVILCTHRLAEAERLCDRLAIMRAGRVVASGSLEELRQNVLPQMSVIVRITSPFRDEQLDFLKNHTDITSVKTLAESELSLGISREDVVPVVVEYFVGQGCGVLAVEPRRASLEDIYLHLQHENGGLKA
jgi:ABC-2 type transport system ATP-binding protein